MTAGHASSASGPSRALALGYAKVASAAVIWGSWSLFLRPANLSFESSTPLCLFVMGVAGLVFVPMQPLPTVAPWTRRTLWLLLVFSLLDAVNALTFFAAMQKTTLAVAVLTHYLAPVLVSMLAPLIDKTRVLGSRRAAVVAFAGLLLVLAPWRGLEAGVATGAMLGFVSAAAYAGNVFVGRRVTDAIGPARAMSYHAFGSALILAPLFSFAEVAAVPASLLGLLVAGAVVVGSLSGIVFLSGLAQIGAARASVLTYLEPVTAVAVGWMVWGEQLQPTAMLGGLLILGAGIFVTTRPTLAPADIATQASAATPDGATASPS